MEQLTYSHELASHTAPLSRENSAMAYCQICRCSCSFTLVLLLYCCPIWQDIFFLSSVLPCTPKFRRNDPCLDSAAHIACSFGLLVHPETRGSGSPRKRQHRLYTLSGAGFDSSPNTFFFFVGSLTLSLLVTGTADQLKVALGYDVLGPEGATTDQRVLGLVGWRVEAEGLCLSASRGSLWGCR